MPPLVVVRPVSGYANRLQAIVSSALLAEVLGGELAICWDPSDVAPVPANAVLDPEFCDRTVRTAHDVVGTLGVDPTGIPDYLAVDADRGVITLAGRHRGEQYFMPALREALTTLPDLRAIVISAGGKFTLEGDEVLSETQERAFRCRRSAAYAELPLNPDIEERAAVCEAHAPFVGLHLRYSDRSTQTPWERAIAPALREVVRATGTAEVFVASDTAQQRHHWLERAQQMGLRPWSADPGSFSRSDPRSAVGALVDWRILTRSQALVYFGASSFAEEAAVASGSYDASIGLTASSTRTAWVRAGQYVEAARTYPRRHGWWGSPS